MGSLFEPKVYERYNALYGLYREHVYYAGVVDLVWKRLGIVLVSIFLSEVPILQIGLLFGVLLGSLVFVRGYKPFYFPLLTQSETRLTIVVLCVVFLGSASYAERNADSPNMDRALFISLVLCLVSFVLVSIHAVVSDTKLIVRTARNKYAAESDRRVALAAQVERELHDMVITDSSLVGLGRDFVRVLGTADVPSNVVTVQDEGSDEGDVFMSTLSSGLDEFDESSE